MTGSTTEGPDLPTLPSQEVGEVADTVELVGARQTRKNAPSGLLTEELIDTIAAVLRTGEFYGAVCRYIGIRESTWYAWLRRGRDAIDAADSLYEDEEDVPQRITRPRATEDNPRAKPVYHVDDIDEKDRRYALLALVVDAADAEGTVRLHASVMTAATGQNPDWRAAVKMLEMKQRSRWGPKVEIDGEVSGTVDHRHVHVHTAAEAPKEVSEHDRHRIAGILASLEEAGRLPRGSTGVATVEVGDPADEPVHPDSAE